MSALTIVFGSYRICTARFSCLHVPADFRIRHARRGVSPFAASSRRLRCNAQTTKCVDFSTEVTHICVVNCTLVD